MAGNASHFDFNEAEMQQSLSEVESAERYVKAHPGMTYEGLVQENTEMAAGLSATPVIGATQDEPPLGIPSWIWGCVFGVAGLAVVYFVTEDKEETKKALWGCIGATVVGVIIYFAAFASAASAF